MIRRIGVELYFPGDPTPVDVSHLYRDGSGTLSLRAFNDSKYSVCNTFSFSLRHDQTIIDKIRSANGKIGIYVSNKSDNSALFTGVIEPSAQQSTHQVVESLKLEAVDTSYLLDEKIDTPFEYPGTIGAEPYKVCDPADVAKSIFHQVCLQAGYLISQINPTIANTSTVLHCASSTGSETYREFLDGLLFEYGLVVDTDADGKLITRRWIDNASNYTDTVSTDLSVVEPLTWERRYIKEDGVTVEWSETAVLEDALLYRDSLPISNDGVFTGKSIAAGDYYPPDSDIEDTFQDYVEKWLDKPYLERSTRIQNRDISLITTDSQTAQFDADDGVQIDAEQYESHRAKVRFQNVAAETKKIYTFEIKGRALYRSAVKKTIVPETAKSPNTITTRFIFDSTAAFAFANALALDMLQGDFEYSFGVNRLIKPGTTVRLINAKNNIDTTVIIQNVDFTIGRPIYRYRGIAVAEHSDLPSTTTTSGGQILWPYLQDVQSQINARPTKQEVINQGFVTLYTRSPSQPATPTEAEPAGWYAAVPAGSDAIWMTGAQKDFDGNLIGTWYSPVRFTGAATILAILTNEQHAIPTDENGDNGNYDGAETEIHIYEGATETTSLWTIGATPSASITGVLTGNKYTVTHISQDSGYVDIVASRTGMDQLSKRFSLTRSRQGDAVPAYNLRVSTSVIKLLTDSSISPPSVTFTAYSSIGLSEPTPYAGIFKVYANEELQFTSSTPQSEFNWDGADNFPGETVYPLSTRYPTYVFDSLTEDLAVLKIELWSETALLKLDTQSIVIFRDVGFQLPDIIEAALEGVPDRTPKYIGRYNQILPSAYRNGDWFLIYGVTDTPYQRGVYRVLSNLQVVRVTGDTGADAFYFVQALPDVLFAVANGYGVTADYGSATFIPNLATNSIFTSALQIGTGQVSGLADALDELDNNKADTADLGSMAFDDLVELAKLGTTVIDGGYIKTELINALAIAATAGFIDQIFSEYIKITGSIRGGDRYKADGTDDNPSAPGFFIGSNGVSKIKDGQFETLNADTLRVNLLTPGNIIIKKYTGPLEHPWGETGSTTLYVQICASGSVRVSFKVSVDSYTALTATVKRRTLAGAETTIFTQSISPTGAGVYTDDFVIDTSLAEGDSFVFVAYDNSVLITSRLSFKDVKIMSAVEPGILSFLGTLGTDTSAPFNPR